MAITYQSAGTVVTGTTPLTPGLPASLATDDICIIIVGGKPDTATVTTPSGWTLIGTGAGGSGAAQNADVGSTRIAAFYRVKDAGWSTMPAITFTNANSAWTVAFRVSRSAGIDWDVASVVGADTSSAANMSVAMATSPGYANGDLVFCSFSTPTDGVASAWTSPVHTATGGTFASATVRAQPATNTGLDCGGVVWTVTSSAATTNNPTISASSNAIAVSGMGQVIRLREMVLTNISGAESNSLAVSESSSVSVTVDKSATDTGSISVSGATNQLVTLLSSIAPAMETFEEGTHLTSFLTRAPDNISYVQVDAGATARYDNTQFNTGAQSAFMWFDTVDRQYLYRDCAGASDVTLDFWIRWSAPAAGANTVIAAQKTSTTANTYFSSIRMASGNVVNLFNGGSIDDTSPTLTANAWHRFTYRINNGAVTCEIRNSGGTLLYTLTGVGTAPTTTQYIGLGTQQSSAGGFSAFVDDVLITTNADVGTPGDTGSISVSDVADVQDVFAGTPISGAESNSLAVSSTVTTNVSQPASESNSLAVSETSAVLKTIPTSDTGSIATSEVSAIASTLPGTESISVSVAETSAVTVTVSASESNSLAASDVSSSSIIQSRTETSAVSVVETATNFVTFSTSDTGSVAISDISNVASTLPGTESIAISVAETSAVAIVQPASESNSLAVSETRTSDITVSRTDTAGISIAETTAFVRSIDASESNSLAVSESSQVFISASISASDTGAVSVSETSNVFFQAPGQDTGSISVADSSSVFASGTSFPTGTETSAVSVSEVSSVIVGRATTDSTAVSVSEAKAFGTIPTSATESNALAISEAVLTAVTLTSGDSSAVSLSDTSSGGNAVSASDTSAVSVTEIKVVQPIVPGSDNAAVSVSESVNIVISGTFIKSASDGIAASVSETKSFFVTNVGSDTNNLAVSESFVFGTIPTSATDTAAVSVTSIVNLVLNKLASDTGAVLIVDIGTTDKQEGFTPKAKTDSVAINASEYSRIFVVGSDAQPAIVYVSSQTKGHFASKTENGIIVNVGGNIYIRFGTSTGRNKSFE